MEVKSDMVGIGLPLLNRMEEPLQCIISVPDDSGLPGHNWSQCYLVHDVICCHAELGLDTINLLSHYSRKYGI